MSGPNPYAGCMSAARGRKVRCRGARHEGFSPGFSGYGLDWVQSFWDVWSNGYMRRILKTSSNLLPIAWRQITDCLRVLAVYWKMFSVCGSETTFGDVWTSHLMLVPPSKVRVRSLSQRWGALVSTISSPRASLLDRRRVEEAVPVAIATFSHQGFYGRRLSVKVTCGTALL